MTACRWATAERTCAAGLAAPSAARSPAGPFQAPGRLQLLGFVLGARSTVGLMRTRRREVARLLACARQLRILFVCDACLFESVRKMTTKTLVPALSSGVP